MNFHQEARKRIIVALDFDDVITAVRLIENLSPYVGYFKIGFELMHHMIPHLLRPGEEDDAVREIGRMIRTQRIAFLLKDRLMWDGKFHDISTTMRKVSGALWQNFRPSFFTVHASAGCEAIRAAGLTKGDAKILGVMIPTTLSDSEIRQIYGCGRKKAFLRLVTQAVKGNVDGLVLNPNDIAWFDEIDDEDIRAGAKKSIKVGVGIRPTWAEKNDQLRSVTPGEAIHLGADFLVIGRPITDPPKAVGDSEDSVQYIVEEVARALKGKEGLKK